MLALVHGAGDCQICTQSGAGKLGRSKGVDDSDICLNEAISLVEKRWLAFMKEGEEKVKLRQEVVEG